MTGGPLSVSSNPGCSATLKGASSALIRASGAAVMGAYATGPTTLRAILALHRQGANMAMTNVQRQAAHRERALHDPDGLLLTRLHVLICGASRPWTHCRA